LVSKFVETFSEVFVLGDDVGYVFSYCSRVQQARTLSREGWDEPISCSLGWVHAPELNVELAVTNDIFDWGHLFILNRLLSSNDVTQLMNPHESGVFVSEERLLSANEFPA
jgi:hypothetical protein